MAFGWSALERVMSPLVLNRPGIQVSDCNWTASTEPLNNEVRYSLPIKEEDNHVRRTDRYVPPRC